MIYIIDLKVSVEIGGQAALSGGLAEHYALIAQNYVEELNTSQQPKPLQINGQTFAPNSMFAIAQRCDYPGKAPDLNDAVAAHPELIDAAAAAGGAR